MKNNYIKLGIILGITIILGILFLNLYRSYEENKSNTSYIGKYVSSVKTKDLSNIMVELTGDNFLYLSYTGNKYIYELENKMYKIVKKNELEDHFIYVDCTDDLNEFKGVSNLKNYLMISNRELVLPAIVYFKDNNPVDFVDSKDGLFDIGELSKLLDEYELGVK